MYPQALCLRTSIIIIFFLQSSLVNFFFYNQIYIQKFRLQMKRRASTECVPIGAFEWEFAGGLCVESYFINIVYIVFFYELER